MSLVSQTIPHLKKIIIKTILRKNSYAPITISKAKLYSALISSRSFYYSDLEGALCFVVDVQNGCFRFLLYDLDSYETLLNIELPQSLKLLYIKFYSFIFLLFFLKILKIYLFYVFALD